MNKKWKIRGENEADFRELEKNPTQYTRMKQSPVTYEQTLDGGYNRVEIAGGDQEEIKLIWQGVDQEQTDLLMGYLNQKVELMDHLRDLMVVFVDSIQKQSLITIANKPQYNLQMTVMKA